MTDRDMISAEIDKRKIQKAIATGRISPEELASAPTILVCGCDREQSVSNDRCENCGADLT